MPSKKLIDQLRSKGCVHWLFVIGLIFIGLRLGEWLSEYNIWVDVRYKVYQILQDLNPRLRYAERTVLVLIDDEEYWKGSLAGRAPIKRDYLARLILAIASTAPKIIAIDVDLRSPDPDGSVVDHPEYLGETMKFIEAVKAITSSSNTIVILPRTVAFDDQKNYVPESAIFDTMISENDKIRIGYIMLPYDARQVPLRLKLRDGEIDSFSMAIARAFDSRSLKFFEKFEKGVVIYGSYMKNVDFPQHFSRDIMNENPGKLRKDLEGKVVIIGGIWHKWGYGRGGQIDTYRTPAGEMGGAFIHANYVEAILDREIKKPLGENIGIWIEVLAAISIAVFLALDKPYLIKLMVVIITCLMLPVISYVLFQNLGRFFDFFIPMILLTGHSIVEQVLKWRVDAQKYAKMRKTH